MIDYLYKFMGFIVSLIISINIHVSSGYDQREQRIMIARALYDQAC